MVSDLTNTWLDFTRVLKSYGNVHSSLQAPCPIEKIREVQDIIAFEFPTALIKLLQLNNGQKLDRVGIFKSVSGWDLYRRAVFLDADSIGTAYSRFVSDAILVAKFGRKEIPFALVGKPYSYAEIFSINRENEEVSLIWTERYDPFNPEEWQIWKFKRGSNLIDFVRMQIRMYE